MATNDRQTIYLAGPIANADAPSGWRDRLKDHYPRSDFIDPLDKFDAPGDGIDIVPGEAHHSDEVEASEIVETDKELIREADAILVGYTDTKQIGTPMEVQYAFRRGYTIAIWLRDKSVLSDLSPWYHYHSDFVTSKGGHAVAYLERQSTTDSCRECGEELGAGYLCDECDTAEIR